MIFFLKLSRSISIFSNGEIWIRIIHQDIYFKDIFKGEYFSKLLEIPEALEELKIHMPEGYKTKEDIIDVINSRALNPNLKALDMSLPTHLNFVLISLNLPPHEGEVNDRMCIFFTNK
ncbi:hypothetical protein PFMG_03084 [Plasmodium falciparum IGH-CR14]|uniref:Uncharacterized protein n=1 Tax=Plasmodium falciparum IGH-CR14 TaxID=580059 RepID=A0A0L1IC08_PLAFA|nr:hypothetical protein PFMG_03084 [Plasmodium falciparum IGH-CR14]